MIIAIMQDTIKKELYIESFNEDEKYDVVAKTHVSDRIPIRVFKSDSYNDAVKAANVMATGKWTYNQKRNAHY